MYYIGIDPGLSGGIVIIDENQELVDKHIMPVIKIKKSEYNIRRIKEILDTYSIDPSKTFIVIEKAHVRPISGKRACFMNGFGFGMLQGLIEGMSFSYEIVTPQRWMKELEIPKQEGKGSILWCQRKYPKERWQPTERSIKPHDGLTDSCCMAVYCYRKNR